MKKKTPKKQNPQPPAGEEKNKLSTATVPVPENIDPKLTQKGEAELLARDYQFQICVRIAMGDSDRMVAEYLEHDLGVKMSFQGVNQNYRHAKKWIPVINYLRRKYLNNIARRPFASKAVRLAALERAYNESMTWRLKTITKHGDEIYGRQPGAAIQAVEAARREVEGEKGINVKVNVSNNTKVMVGLSDDKIKDMPTDELIREVNNRLLGNA